MNSRTVYRTSRAGSAVLASILLLAGCGGAGGPGFGPGPSGAVTTDPSAAPTRSTVAPTLSAGAASTPPPNAAPVPSPGSSSVPRPAGPLSTTLAAALTTVPPEALVLPPASRTGVVEWESVGLDCRLGRPAGARAMRSDQEGDGAFETSVTVQQVAAFADAAAAQAEANRVSAAMRACAQNPQLTTKAVPVGAQGVGLAYSYGPTSSDYPYGSCLVLTRRGNALSMSGSKFGEGSLGSATEAATTLAREGWEALCVFDRTRGC